MRWESSSRSPWLRAVQLRSSFSLSASSRVKSLRDTLPCLMFAISLLISFSTKERRPPSSSKSCLNSTIFFLGRLFPAHWASLFQNSTSSFKFLAIIFGFFCLYYVGLLPVRKRVFKSISMPKKSIIIFYFFRILPVCSRILLGLIYRN